MEMRIVLVPKTIMGSWCSHNEHSQSQHILIMQDFEALVLGDVLVQDAPTLI